MQRLRTYHERPQVGLGAVAEDEGQAADHAGPHDEAAEAVLRHAAVGAGRVPVVALQHEEGVLGGGLDRLSALNARVGPAPIVVPPVGGRQVQGLLVQPLQLLAEGLWKKFTLSG